jgi:hypothetical protein
VLLDTRGGTRALLLLSALVAAAFLGSLLMATGGRFVPPLTDLYVVCQYAKAMAEGHPFRYNAGETPSTGATSLLLTAVLALANALGAKGEGLVAVAIGLGGVLYAASVGLARRLGELLGQPREGLLAGALVALGGPVVWGFFYGSDIALFLFLSLWLFEGLVVAWNGGGLRGAVVAATLLALARPEGLPLAAIVGAAWAWDSRSRRLAFAPALGAGLGVLALARGLTGSWLGSSGADKSLLASYGLVDGMSLATEYAIDVVRGLLLGFYPSQAPIGFARGWAPLMFPPLGLALVLLALAMGKAGARRATAVWCLALLVVAALDIPNVFMGVHFNRYLLWALPSLLVLVAVGTGSLACLASRGDPAQERRVFALCASLLLVLSGFATLRFAGLYAEMAGEIARRDVAAARFISDQLPAGAPIASAATSVEFLTGHRNLNLHGVTSPAFFGGRTAERELCVLEGLGRLSPDERPAWLLSSVAVQEGSVTLRELAPGPPLFVTTSGSDELLLLETRWDAFAAATETFLPETEAAIAGRREVDRLNVGDDRDETAHGYVARSTLGNLRLWGTARVADYELPGARRRVADAGRAILGEESFRVHTQPGKELLLVLRTAPELEARVFRAAGARSLGLAFTEAHVAVRIADRLVAEARFRPRQGWDERVVAVPPAALSAGETRLTVAGRFASFRYWFYQ